MDNKFSSGRSHLNGIECFWSFAKRRLLNGEQYTFIEQSFHYVVIANKGR